MNDLGQLARLATPTLRRRLQITSNRHFIRICENAQFWVGALDGFDVAHPGPAVTEDGVALARHVAADGTVLVHNAGALPLDASAVTSVAVIGHNARYARSQGGGSATVIPERVVSPLEGIRAVLPGAEVTYSVGAVVQEGVAELPLAAISNPATGGPGVRVRFLRKGRELFAEDRRATALVWFGGDVPISDSDTLELSTRYVPEISGPIVLGFAAVGMARIFVDGRLRDSGLRQQRRFCGGPSGSVAGGICRRTRSRRRNRRHDD